MTEKSPSLALPNSTVEDSEQVTSPVAPPEAVTETDSPPTPDSTTPERSVPPERSGPPGRPERRGTRKPARSPRDRKPRSAAAGATTAPATTSATSSTAASSAATPTPPSTPPPPSNSPSEPEALDEETRPLAPIEQPHANEVTTPLPQVKGVDEATRPLPRVETSAVGEDTLTTGESVTAATRVLPRIDEAHLEPVPPTAAQPVSESTRSAPDSHWSETESVLVRLGLVGRLDDGEAESRGGPSHSAAPDVGRAGPAAPAAAPHRRPEGQLSPSDRGEEPTATVPSFDALAPAAPAAPKQRRLKKATHRTAALRAGLRVGSLLAVLLVAAVPALVLTWRSALADTPDPAGVLGGGLGAVGLGLLAVGGAPLAAGRYEAIRAELAVSRWSAVLVHPTVLALAGGFLVLFCAVVAVG